MVRWEGWKIVAVGNFLHRINSDAKIQPMINGNSPAKTYLVEISYVYKECRGYLVNLEYESQHNFVFAD